MQNYKNYFELDTPSFGGMNNAMQFALIPRSQSPRMDNAYMDQLGDASKRPGSIPVIQTALGNPIKHLTIFPFGTPQLLASSGTSLYKYDSNALTSVTMTDSLNSADIYTADFTVTDSGALANVKLIGDGGILKVYDGTAVEDVTPAADDPSPQPANALIDINTKGFKFLWEYSGHIFGSPGTNEVFYSKRVGEGDNCYNYWPETNFELLVRKGDYVSGPGIPFDNVQFIPMRNGWNVWQGSSFDDFDATEFLNTINGVIAPRTPRIITYADGTQTIAYLSDDGVHEIFTTILDSRGKQYATKGLMKDKIDFASYGFTEAEMTESISRYIVSLNMYLLEISRDTTNYVFGFETRSKEWYVWTNLQINSLIEMEGICYFAGDDGLLKKFDKELYSDWDDMDKTTGTPVYFKRYSPAIAAEFSGFASMWDAYLVESQQWYVPATLDITFIFANQTDVMESVIKNEVFVEGVSQWGFAKYININFTDLLNEPNEILFDYSRLSKYVQTLIENNRDEPVKLYKEVWKGRASGR